ncbi:hypothetical protein AQ824_07355 [Burkholderia pseudomallei]|nr:hypothetical protein BGI50_22470 [Burkholderia pseudomallei]OMO09156.1 hypothetical protein BGI48_22615 [Burkholderia pseudomallei]OMS86410.1 hypothetical protein AQ748_13650 [Burkholderia pseudomallei]OMW61634.1 hypothetical protein AQ812_02480 [Burkholderia pseudomallei]OMW73915.1 hypothetical protein AQ813_07365 [Burkholderia pseudomallei]
MSPRVARRCRSRFSGFIAVHRGQCRFDPRRATMPFGVAGAFDASRPRRIRRDAGSGIAAP